MTILACLFEKTFIFVELKYMCVFTARAPRIKIYLKYK